MTRYDVDEIQNSGKMAKDALFCSFAQIRSQAPRLQDIRTHLLLWLGLRLDGELLRLPAGPLGLHSSTEPHFSTSLLLLTTASPSSSTILLVRQPTASIASTKAGDWRAMALVPLALPTRHNSWTVSEKPLSQNCTE